VNARLGLVPLQTDAKRILMCVWSVSHIDTGAKGLNPFIQPEQDVPDHDPVKLIIQQVVVVPFI